MASVDLVRAQARLIAHHWPSVEQTRLEALAAARPHLSKALHPLDHDLLAGIQDALLCILAADALTVDQRRVLLAPIVVLIQELIEEPIQPRRLTPLPQEGVS